MNWLTDTKIPVGKSAKAGFEWLRDNAEWFFERFEDALTWLIEAILVALNYPNPLIVVALFVALTWAIQRNWKPCLLIFAGFLFILNQGYWEETMESLTLVAFACLTCMAIGVPIGIAAAHRPRLYSAISPVLDLMQTLPTFVYLIPMIVFFGIGMVPGLVATVIFVVPAPIRLTYLGVHATPMPLLEAAASAEDPSRVIMVGSIDGLNVSRLPTFSYGPSKAAIHHLARTLAAHLADRHITVNAIAPGLFPSKMTAATIEKLGEQIRQGTPLKRYGKPEDMAGVAIYLASPAASFVTGVVIPVDGGITGAKPTL